MSNSNSSARRSPIARLVALSCTLLLVSCGPSAPPEPSAPTASRQLARNVLLISLDTLRADHLGAWGYHRDTSPFLDDLASRGTRYPLAFVNTHGTPPSHATLLTSLYQFSHGIGMDGYASSQITPLPRRAISMAEIFRDAGWATIAVTDGGHVNTAYGFDRGFDVWDQKAKGIASGRDRLLRYLSDSDPDCGQFLFLHTYEVHSDYISPPEFDALYDVPKTDFVPTSRALLDLANDASALSEDDLAHVIASYDRGIRYTDQVLSDLFLELGELGFLDEAIVVISSDHGEEFGEHGGLLHGLQLFEELIHVPLIVAGHGVPRRVDDSLVSTIDIAPTILAACGLDTPPSMAGRDLLAPPPAGAPELIYAQFGPSNLAVRGRRFKLIENLSPGPHQERSRLYDLEADPGETTDVADQHPDVVRDLRRRLRDWHDQVPKRELLDRPTHQLSSQDVEQLKSLGYLGGD